MLKKNNINILPLEDKNFDIEKGIKYGLLLGIYNDEKYIVINEKKQIEAFNYYSKIDYDYPILITDDESFNRLVSKFLEIKTNYDLQSSNTQEELEEDFNELLNKALDVLDSEDNAPVIKFVNSLFYQAIKKNASDIHIESHELYGLIRFRIDGVLFTQAKINKKLLSLIINRIKVISNLDISEKRKPQDGRCQIKILNQITDIRVSILPTYYGEKIVLRLLKESSSIPTLQDLGFDYKIQSGLEELMKYSYGMILVTGPTGSGKSTTLHSFLQSIATPTKNIITIEDPVEYKADNINQIQVNPKAGLTFSTGLRSILRQDPDIIMVGEIRDSETAKIAIQAALTGHLLLSTLHTNNALSTITRLLDIGIDKYLIASALNGVLAQRLVRILCTCKKKDKEGYKAVGCEKCNFTGYQGRRAVGELLILDDNIRDMIIRGANEVEIKNFLFEKNLFEPITEKLKKLYLTGETSEEEIYRVGVKY